MRTRRRFGAIAMVVAALALALGSAPAFADTGSEGGPPLDYSNGGGDSGGTVNTTHQSCFISSSPSYLGAVCPTGTSGGLKNIKDLLAGEEFKECWDDPLDAAQVEARGLATPASPNGGKWYVKKCIEGIDAKTLDVKGQIKVVERGTPYVIEPWQQVTTLGPNETKLVEAHQGQIPYPNIGVTPTPELRVGKWLAFSDGYRIDAVNHPSENVVPVQALGFALEARETNITVEPLGANKGVKLTCDGLGTVAAPGDQPTKTGCWYRYLRSSASQPKARYPIKISAHWVVTATDPDGTVEKINEFDKSQTIYTSVSEIQTVNVPGKS